MSYIGNIPTTAAFVTDQFSANGSGTTFTLSAAPATTSSILVAVSGVLQDPSTYSVSGTTLTFSAAPPAGTGNISVRFLGIPASGVVTTAYRTVTDFTATAGQTTFSPPSYTAGFIDVYRNGVKLGAADFTATNGTTVVLANACTAGDLVQIVSFQVSSVLNAMPTNGGTFTGSVFFGAGNGVWDTSGNVGIGTSSPGVRLQVGNPSDSNQSLRFDFSDSSTARINSTRLGSGNLQSLLLAGQDTIQFQTVGTERMRIDSSGRVTMPFQTAFSAFNNTSGNITYNAGDTIVFNDTRFNTGNNYSTSTGRFTAPVAGAYLFCLNLYSNNSDYRRYRLLKNGTDAFCGQGAITGSGIQATLAGVVYLNANDYVIVTPAYSGSVVFQDNNHTTFSGHLIG